MESRIGNLLVYISIIYIAYLEFMSKMFCDFYIFKPYFSYSHIFAGIHLFKVGVY